ncbi:hypothetical protein PIB30_039450 [Stylosanthes scabra]|uniref:Uncharacterized protein n=1 Tax=Stylosanthes scabra TaxID=79078 RepID=A0ABU6UG91_9FABA|nr:hypothetical protein [Stylosanthes scabra]
MRVYSNLSWDQYLTPGIRAFNYNDESPRPERVCHVFGAVAGDRTRVIRVIGGNTHHYTHPDSRHYGRTPSCRYQLQHQMFQQKKRSRRLSRQRNDKALGWREKAHPKGTLRLHVGGPADSLHCIVSPNQCRKKKWSSRSVMTQCRRRTLIRSRMKHCQLRKVEGGEDLPKNDVYDALWAMLDAESGNEAEEIPGEWDHGSVLQN